MQLSSQKKSKLLLQMKFGALSGLVCGVGLYAMIFGIDLQLQIPYGTFYKMVGILFGFSGDAALYLGVILHLITATLIGMVFASASLVNKLLYLSSMKKSVFAGAITGIEVFALIFMPVTVYLMIPMLQEISDSGIAVDQMDSLVATKILAQIDQILWGSLVIHILFGMTLGFVIELMSLSSKPRKIGMISDASLQ